ncbi:MAG: hypothetical protein K2X27_11080, partial [Candidatus Obscuribacterales bacterium]|nr:hypothetical protein [Candidatus Obscuribacterales bacterium]
LSQLPFSKQQECFKQVFGTPADLLDTSSRVFNLLMAMQDLKRFEAADFELWFLSQSNDDVPMECGEVFFQIAEKILGEAASAAQASSLALAWNLVPYWRVLESHGPWTDDPLADFVCALLNKIDKLRIELDCESLIELDGEYCSLLKELREDLPSNFQPSLIILVEGITETILLPKFLALSTNKSAAVAATFIACGGANQLLRRYLQLQDATRIPILCVVDQDAIEQADTITDVLREQDYLHIWSGGEIEDAFPQQSILDTLNKYLQSLGASELLMADDLPREQRRTEVLNRLWRNRGLGDFDKVDFAEFQVSRLKTAQDVPNEGKKLMDNVREMALRENG